jgi:hypothetical protein
VTRKNPLGMRVLPQVKPHPVGYLNYSSLLNSDYYVVVDYYYSSSLTSSSYLTVGFLLGVVVGVAGVVVGVVFRFLLLLSDVRRILGVRGA